MMVLRRHDRSLEHRQFSELTQFIEPGDLLVLNDTRVLRARRLSDDARLEFLFLENLGPRRWTCLVKPGRKARVGSRCSVGGVNAEIEEILPEGERVVVFAEEFDLLAGGSMPLPPYLKRQSDARDDEQYQTVFARAPGAVAAPTAGLHFTPEILRQLPHAFVTLHVGPGTFRPVHSEDVTAHKMHAEKFSISTETAARVNAARRVIAVGTTTVRVLESSAQSEASSSADPGSMVSRACVRPIENGETSIFIYPPFDFRAVHVLLTNFHLPRSTLLMLVSAFAGRDFILRAYEQAVRERYRFFSYGDCMLIL
jgi:S-adenosylmethionine:tRNA ribosyltransferase-isomerase